VLVIEDNADTRESLCLLLSLSGCDVREAADGAEGLRRALLWCPDAVVCDIGMPGLDGWQVARRLRRALGPGVLLVALTGYGQGALTGYVDVHQGHVGPDPGGQDHRGRPVVGGVRLVAPGPQQQRQAVGGVGAVVHDEDAAHGAPRLTGLLVVTSTFNGADGRLSRGASPDGP
jgi:CheY-like chemotaxis protein